jgi:hypothetical protein
VGVEEVGGVAVVEGFAKAPALAITIVFKILEFSMLELSSLKPLEEREEDREDCFLIGSRAILIPMGDVLSEDPLSLEGRLLLSFFSESLGDIGDQVEYVGDIPREEVVALPGIAIDGVGVVCVTKSGEVGALNPTTLLIGCVDTGSLLVCPESIICPNNFNSL